MALRLLRRETTAFDGSADRFEKMLSPSSVSVNPRSWQFHRHAKDSRVGDEPEIEATKRAATRERKKKFYGHWNETPDILLEEIFSYLKMRDRYYASLTCRSWHRAFDLQKVWHRFVLGDATLTRGKFNYYSGWQYVLDHTRTSACLNRVGKHFRSLVFEPMLNFYNLYEFMNMVSWYAERGRSDGCSLGGVGTHVRHLKYTFPCNMANREDSERGKLFGTGGKLLQALKRLTGNLTNLRCLEFIDLMLDNGDALHLLDDLCTDSGETLRKLVLVNVTRCHCPLIHIGVFLNLRVLVVSPQNLDADVLELLAYTKLEHLHIMQNRYSPVGTTIRLPKGWEWSKMRKNNPGLKVHFESESNKPEDAILPIELSVDNGVPCHSIVIDNSTIQVSPATVMEHAARFGSTLRVYALKGRSKYYQHKNFAKRLDEALVGLCKLCPNLHTLMIRDKISTATILRIVDTAKSLRNLYVRRNVILKRCDRDWTIISDISNEKYRWMKINSRDYENTEREVSKIFAYRWRMLSEKEFKNQNLNLYL